MAKRMNDDHKIVGLSPLILLGIACWGGLVRYLIDVKQNKATWSWINAFRTDRGIWLYRSDWRVDKR